MERNTIATDEYLKWLIKQTNPSESVSGSYDKLLKRMHETTFIFSVHNDRNRALDGMNLRIRFADETGISEAILKRDIYGPCTVLEMMVALAIRCEESIMSDDSLGNRTSVWFWTMVENLGLLDQTDDQYNEGVVDDILYRFLLRKYSADGTGGLFHIENPPKNLRRAEIWYQMNWYMSRILTE